MFTKLFAASVLALTLSSVGLTVKAQSAGDDVLLQNSSQGATITGNRNNIRTTSAQEFLGDRVGSAGNMGVNQKSDQFFDVAGNDNTGFADSIQRGRINRR